jgi:hypothetical protein
MKQTAIDWLVKQLLANENINTSAHIETLIVHFGNKAKEIEKDQIMQSYFDGCFHEIKGFGNKPDDYYNDQFISVKP